MWVFTTDGFYSAVRAILTVVTTVLTVALHLLGWHYGLAIPS